MGWTGVRKCMLIHTFSDPCPNHHFPTYPSKCWLKRKEKKLTWGEKKYWGKTSQDRIRILQVVHMSVAMGGYQKTREYRHHHSHHDRRHPEYAVDKATDSQTVVKRKRARARQERGYLFFAKSGTGLGLSCPNTFSHPKYHMHRIYSGNVKCK